ncbi:hypothetical protein EE612_017931 [Oryza sativa]|nr:hypothetical protein EE612_017931 [Oryza sativa]
MMVMVVATAVWKFMAFLNKAVATARCRGWRPRRWCSCSDWRRTPEFTLRRVLHGFGILGLGIGDFGGFFLQECELWIWDVNWGM